MRRGIGVAEKRHIGRGYFQLFGNRSFAFLWSGSLASQLGDHLNLMALTALVYAVSGGQARGLEFSKILLLASAPVLIVGPISGVYAHRLDRKKMLTVSDVVRAVRVAASPLFSLSMAPIYVVVFVIFAINRFYLSARSAAIPQVVEDDELLAANSFLNVAMMATIVLGPWGGGAIVERFGYAAGFWADAATYLVSALLASFITLKSLAELREERRRRSLVARVRGDWAKHSAEHHAIDPAWLAEEAGKLGREIATPIEEEVGVIGSVYQRFLADLKDGIARMRGDRLVIYSTIAFSAIMLVAGFVLVACPVLVKNEFGMGAAELGMLFSVAGAGMLVGSLLVGRFLQRVHRRVIIAGSFLLAGADIMIVSQLESIAGLGVGLFAAGLVAAPIMVACDTILQERMAGESVGKGFAFRDMISKAAFGVAGILSGIVVDIIGTRPLLAIVGALCVGFSVASVFLLADASKLNLLNAYPLFRLGLSIAARVPRRAAYALATVLGDVAALLLPQKRRWAGENIARVIGKPPSSPEVRSLVRQVFRSYGMYYADFFGMAVRNEHDVESLVRIEGLEHLKDALSLGKGAIFVTAHIGSWDVGGAALAAVGDLPELSALVEPVSEKASKDAMAAMRQDRGINVIHLGNPMKVLRALRRNGIVFILGERAVGAGGTEVDFFGEKAYLPRGAAYWALKSGAPIVPGFCIRQPDGTYVGHIEPPIIPEPAGDLDDDVRRHTQRIAEVIERYVARYPEQWCMLQPVWQGNWQ